MELSWLDGHIFIKQEGGKASQADRPDLTSVAITVEELKFWQLILLFVTFVADSILMGLVDSFIRHDQNERF